MRRLITAAALVALCGCTPAELAGWVVWHDRDPVAAVAFARQPDVVADLATGEHEATVAADRNDQPSSRWDRIARCESGGRWDYPPVTNSTGTYSGGLMIWTKAWIAYGGQEFAGQAWQASKAEQIVVAERILADRGWQAWDCA
jgi:hypothetical protein